MNLEFNRVYVDANEMPAVIERYAGNKYLYRYDLRQEEPVQSEENESPMGRYSFVDVRLVGYPNHNETIKYLIRQLISLEDELKLINDYNESVLFEPDSSTSEGYQDYITYLEVRRTIKSKVKTDFSNNKAFKNNGTV